MTARDTPSVVVCYYDPKHDPENQPKLIAHRCTAEIVLLCDQLGTTIEQLSLALRRKRIDDAVHLCQFHHENAIFRIYALRERAWDVLAALADVNRRSTGNKTFRESVLSKIEGAYPGLNDTFSNLLRLIDSDVRTRNVATHETFLFLGLTFGDDFQNTYEIAGVLTWHDPKSEEGPRIQKMVRKALREFVAEDKKHIQEIVSLAFDFVRHCHDAIDRKRW